MKQICFSALLALFALTSCRAQTNNIWQSGGISQTVGPPTFKPGAKGNIVAIDTVTGTWYVSRDRYAANGNWLSMGQRIEQISGCSAPAYTPNKYNSDLVINNCAVPELYYHSGGGVWVQLNDGATYTAGTGIDVTGTVITNTAPDQTVAITGGGINSVSGTYPSFTVTGTEVDGSTSNELQTLSVGSGTTTLSNSGGSMTIAGAGINSVGTAGTTITITGTEVDGSTTNELQTIANTSDATSHTVTLSNSGGSTQLVEGSNITLTTTGTSGAGIVTIAATGGATDLSISGSSSPLTINSSTGTDITATAGTGISLAGTSGNMTISNSAPSLWTDAGTDTYLTSTTDNVAIGATAAGSKLDIITNSLGTTQTNTSGLLLSNTTAAAAGAQQISPAIRWRGNGWKTNATAASQTVDFRADVRPVQGAANPTGALVFNASVNGAAYGNQLFSIRSDGHISMGTSASSNYVLNVNNTTDQIAAVIGNFNFNNALNGGAGTGMGIAAFSGAAYLYNTNGAFSIKTNTGFGTELERLKADASGYISVGAGNATGAAWGLNGIVFRSVASACGSVDNTTSASATVTNNVANSFAIPAFASTNASITYTNAANMYIAGAPTTSSGCGLNTPTLTNKYALWVDADVTRLDGKVMVNGSGTPTDFLEVTGNIALTTAGNKLKIATGSNASIGTSTLVAGTVTVSTTAVATGSHIVVCYDTPAGTLASGLSAPTASIVNATSFVINSLTTAGLVNTLDTSTVRWWIIN